MEDHSWTRYSFTASLQASLLMIMEIFTKCKTKPIINKWSPSRYSCITSLQASLFMILTILAKCKTKPIINQFKITQSLTRYSCIASLQASLSSRQTLKCGWLPLPCFAPGINMTVTFYTTDMQKAELLASTHFWLERHLKSSKISVKTWNDD